jgi:phospholipase C
VSDNAIATSVATGDADHADPDENATASPGRRLSVALRSAWRWFTGADRPKDMPPYVFVAQILWALGLMALFLAYIHGNDRLDLPPRFGGVPVEAPWLGAVGGLMVSFSAQYFSRGEWDPRFNYWHLVRPLTGAASGAVACLLVIVLARTAGASHPLQLDTTALDAVAFVFGYAEESFRELIKAVTDVFLKPGNKEPGESKGSASKDGGEPGGGGDSAAHGESGAGGESGTGGGGSPGAPVGAPATIHVSAVSSAAGAAPKAVRAAVPAPASRKPGELPFPALAPGSANEALPFDHVVVVMMENHSFDNLLGDLSRTRGYIDGLTFDGAGKPLNSNPGTAPGAAPVEAFALESTAQRTNVTQSWPATRAQIDGGKMDGFVETAKGTDDPMGYYTAEVLPFAYSLASQFTVANRWFCSVPGPTYPNRRFLLAGTAFGGTVTSPEALLDPPPKQGTIFDRLTEHGVSWADYFTDVPMTLAIPSIFLKHARNHHQLERFFQDCKAGTLPAVSFVDPGVGAVSSLAASFGGLPDIVKEALRLIGVDGHLLEPSETQEDPADMYHGEIWAYEVVEAVLKSPAWSRTLLIYTYDEHGGYYDHVPPPAAIPPDEIPAKLEGGGEGAYDMYGPRVPAVIVSPYSRPGGASSTIYDHTSVLATIEHKWNLPALTKRDANAASVIDCLDLSTPALLEPEPLSAPAKTGPSGPAKAAT